MKASSATTTPKTATAGWWWAALGMSCFSFTLPATRLTVPEFGGYTVGFGRAVIAALLAVALMSHECSPLYSSICLMRENDWVRGYFGFFGLPAAVINKNVAKSRNSVRDEYPRRSG